MVQMVQYNKDVNSGNFYMPTWSFFWLSHTVFTTDDTTKEASSQTDDKPLYLAVEIGLPILVAVVIFIIIIVAIYYKR